MPENITIPIKYMGYAELRNMLDSVKKKVSSLELVGHGQGNTPEFWSAVAEMVGIQGELDLRKAKNKDTF